jgi:hypothetical protein
MEIFLIILWLTESFAFGLAFFFNKIFAFSKF